MFTFEYTYSVYKKNVNMTTRKRFLKRNRKKLITSLVIALFVVTFLQLRFVQEFSWAPVANVSCHYICSNNTVPLLKTSLPQKSIFFHETSCPGNLTARQVCAIESAARTHPTWQINVVFSGPAYSKTLNGAGLLQKFRNVKFWTINIEMFTKNTPLESLVSSRILRKCQWGMERTKDVLKYLFLYKFGGMYLDLDIIIARPLGSLARNWAARENVNEVGDGVLFISKNSIGRNVTEAAIRYIASLHNNNDWCKENPDVMTKVLQKLCATVDASYMSSTTCDGFEVYGSQFFYPIEKQWVREYFVPGEVRFNGAYSYYLFGYITNKHKVLKSSPYSKLARRFCPKTYHSYFDEFDVT